MNDPDAHIRSAAFSAMEKLVRYQPDGLVRWDAIHRGFQVGSEHIHTVHSLHDRSWPLREAEFQASPENSTIYSPSENGSPARLSSQVTIS